MGAEETKTDIAAELWRETAVTVAKQGLNAARALLRQHAIEPYQGWTEAPRKDRGDQTHWIDAEMRDVMSRLVAEASGGGAIHVGEEEQIPMNMVGGEVLARTDELDGTTNALTLFSSFAIVVFIERVRSNRESVTHVAGAIAAATGEVTSWSREQGGKNKVLIEWPAPFSWEDEGGGESDATGVVVPKQLLLESDHETEVAAALRPGTLGRLASNASRHDRRLLIGEAMGRALRQEDDLWLSNAGGNPVIAPLLAGELSAVYEPKSLELHDAAYIVPLYLAGGEIWSPHGNRIDVLRQFQKLGSRREIGPFVAGTSTEAVDRILEALQRENATP